MILKYKGIFCKFGKSKRNMCTIKKIEKRLKYFTLKESRKEKQ